MTDNFDKSNDIITCSTDADQQGAADAFCVPAVGQLEVLVQSLVILAKEAIMVRRVAPPCPCGNLSSGKIGSHFGNEILPYFNRTVVRVLTSGGHE